MHLYVGERLHLLIYVGEATSLSPDIPIFRCKATQPTISSMRNISGLTFRFLWTSLKNRENPLKPPNAFGKAIVDGNIRRNGSAFANPLHAASQQ